MAALARRPGTYALVIGCASGSLRARLVPPAGRQFNGHGAYSADGTRLYTRRWSPRRPGRDRPLGHGDWQRLAEFPSQGIGPHEVRRLPGSEVLVVANGGIRTDPQDRTMLNLDSMRPNLSYLSPDGALIDQIELPAELHQASIRHLALAEDGAVAFAMQWEGDPAEPVPLLGLHRRGEAARLCPPRDADLFAHAGLCRLDRAFGRADRADLAPGRCGAASCRRRRAGRDPCPARCLRRAPAAEGGFVVTDGGGTITRLTPRGLPAAGAHRGGLG
ncbi:MAG: DUF1513 domain-containing protein [Rhodopseudomonas palustris]|nr:DUF1513 domain-containing protein [Rhodopseudomonas palustris]